MKRYIFGLIAIVFAFSLAGFTSANKIEKQKNNFANKWFVYNSGFHDVESSYSLYQPTEEDPMPPSCDASTRLCAIFANDANSNNILDNAELTSYLSTADANHNGTLDDESVSSTLIKKP